MLSCWPAWKTKERLETMGCVVRINKGPSGTELCNGAEKRCATFIPCSLFLPLAPDSSPSPQRRRTTPLVPQCWNRTLVDLVVEEAVASVVVRVGAREEGRDRRAGGGVRRRYPLASSLSKAQK